MGAWFAKFQALIWAASLLGSAMAYAYANFATKEYVDAKHESVQTTLSDIKTTLNRVDKRLFDLAINGSRERRPTAR